MKNITYIAMFLAMIALIYAIIYTRKKNGERTSAKGEYDERQDRIRGRGYKIAAFSYMIEFAFLIFADGVELNLPLTNGAMYAIMFVLPIGIFVVYCINRDAFIGVRNNMKGYLTLAVIVVIANAASTIAHAVEGSLIVDGRLTGACLSPAVGMLFLVVVISLLVRNNQLRAEEGMADEES